MPSAAWAKTLSSPWWVVATSMQSSSRNSSSSERARAAPSDGSVPAPSSSSSTSVRGPAALMIRTMLVMCAEKVESDCSIDCSSPMSAKMSCRIGSRVPSSAGIGSPAWAIRQSSPTVLSATVLPPVLGPVIRTQRASALSVAEIGTTSPVSSGWRAECRIKSVDSSEIQLSRSSSAGSGASSSAASRALAWARSMAERQRVAARIAPASSPISRQSARRMRSTSRSSSRLASRSRLPSSTTASGSTNSVAPEAETSWTTLGSALRSSALIGIT